MSNITLTNLDLNTLNQFVYLTKQSGHPSLEAYFSELIDKTFSNQETSQLSNLTEIQMQELCIYLIGLVTTDFENLKEDEDFISPNSFRLIDLYKYISSQSNFSYPKWENLTRYSKIEIGKKFKIAISEFNFKKDGYKISMLELPNSSNSTLYKISRSIDWDSDLPF